MSRAQWRFDVINLLGAKCIFEKHSLKTKISILSVEEHERHCSPSGFKSLDAPLCSIPV